MRVASLIAGLVFLLSAIIQWNDPDPWAWIAIYLVAGLVSLAFWRGSLSWWVPATVGVVALIWGVALAPSALADFRVSDLAKTMQAETPAIELSRELLGLLIVVAWMAVLTWEARRRAAS